MVRLAGRGRNCAVYPRIVAEVWICRSATITPAVVDNLLIVDLLYLLGRPKVRRVLDRCFLKDGLDTTRLSSSGLVNNETLISTAGTPTFSNRKPVSSLEMGPHLFSDWRQSHCAALMVLRAWVRTLCLVNSFRPTVLRLSVIGCVRLTTMVQRYGIKVIVRVNRFDFRRVVKSHVSTKSLSFTKPLYLYPFFLHIDRATGQEPDRGSRTP